MKTFSAGKFHELLALNSSLETEPEFKFSSVSPLYYYLFLSVMSPLWTSLIQALRGKTYFCSAIYRSYVGKTRVRPDSSCWGILPRKPCPLQMPQWAFVAFLGEMIKMLISISGLLWCFGCPWQSEEEIWVEEFNSFLLKPWRGVNAPGTNSTICRLYYEDFFRAFGKWIGKTGIRHKATKGPYQCADKLYNVSGSNSLSFCIVL